MHDGTIYILGINRQKRVVYTKSILPCVTGVIKLFSPLLPGSGTGGAIQAIVVNIPEPLAFTFRDIVKNLTMAIQHPHLRSTKP